MAKDTGVITIVGVVADALGAASRWVTVESRGAGRNFDVRREFLSLPSTEYRSVQAPRIVVDLNHAWPVGELRYLERNEQRLFAVSEIDASTLGEGPWFYSPAIRHTGGKDIELRSLAITHDPASIALGPLTAYAGGLREAAGATVYQTPHRDLLRRAHEHDRRRKTGEPLVVNNPPSLPPEPRHDSYDFGGYHQARAANERLGVHVAPQNTPGWKVGQVEWAAPGRVISVR